MCIRDSFVAINCTAGRWMGVSPYVAVNSINDITIAENRIAKSKKPGWIVSMIDTPLWCYSEPMWKSGHNLYRILNYIKGNGSSKKIINVTPHVISRFAKILHSRGLG